MGVWVFVAAFAPWIAPHSPMDLDVMNRLEPPEPVHLFGTDEAGRDNFSRVLYGARITIPVAFIGDPAGEPVRGRASAQSPGTSAGASTRS